jgi:hypothetical protein
VVREYSRELGASEAAFRAKAEDPTTIELIEIMNFRFPKALINPPALHKKETMIRTPNLIKLIKFKTDIFDLKIMDG